MDVLASLEIYEIQVNVSKRMLVVPILLVFGLNGRFKYGSVPIKPKLV